MKLHSKENQREIVDFKFWYILINNYEEKENL
jgi:hypothetical protein